MRLDLGLVLGVFLELLIMIYYANTTLYPKKNYFVSSGIAVVGYIFMFIVAMFSKIILNNVVSFIINSLIFICGYKIRLSSAVFRSILMGILVFIGETLIMFLLGLTFNINDTLYITPERSLLVTIGGKIIYFIGILILKSIEKGKNRGSDQSLLILMVVPIITLIFVWVFVGTTLNKWIFIMLSMVAVFANIMTFALNEYIISKNNRIRNLEIENSKNQLELEEYKHLNINYEENRLFRHDLKEHLAVLKSLISEDSDKAIEYMQKIEDISSRTKIEKYSDNPILNMLLIQKARECRKKEIALNIKSTNPYINFLDDVDIIAIFSNLINNAIEASSNSTEKNIFFDLSTGNETFIVIRVENSCETEPIVSDGILKTRKGDSQNHGIGIRSVKNALDKYNGHIDWNYDKESRMFKTTILLKAQH